MAVTDEVDLLYNTEKWLIERHWHDERRLNMSAGARACRHHPNETTAPVPEGGGALPAFPRNPRLTPDQVRAIRALAGLATTTEIARRVSAGSTRQVRNVVVERTYRSVR